MAGTKKSGRKGYKEEWDFFSKLDKALPEIVDYCLEVIRRTKESNLKQDTELGLKASQILMSKAPQRVQGTGDEGEIVVKQIIYGGNNTAV